MADQALSDLIAYLEKTNENVKRLETEGDAVLDSEGQLAFQAKLEEKAELLSGLSEKTWKLAKQIEGELGEAIVRRLEQFSMSASTALRIGSVFFMTALLYPEGHNPGDPNDLETFIEELKKQA